MPVRAIIAIFVFLSMVTLARASERATKLDPPCQWPVSRGGYPLAACGTVTAEAAGNVVEACTRALGHSPDDESSLHFVRGLARLQRLFCGGGRADFEGAVVDLGIVASRDPTARDAFAARGLAFEYVGDHANAVAEFRHADRIGVPPAWLVERLESFEALP